MFNMKSKKTAEDTQKLSALGKSQAIIEFQPDGTIITANENFLSAMGYTLDEVQGKHHSLFVESDYKSSSDYQSFWQQLRDGKFQATQFKRVAKGGKEIWIEASYNPVLDKEGKTYKVVKFATDITERKRRDSDYQGQIAAIHKSQAVIEFNLDGTIITANKNFLDTVGYSLDEVRGKHHRLFVESSYASSADYAKFWETLRSGQFQAAQYKRFGKGGKEIWIEASYNPIMDANGKPYKVVKYATDITSQIHLMQELRRLLSEIDGSMEETNLQCTSASAAATETSTNVQSVASGAEELEASIQEIARSMTQSTAAVDNAMDKTTEAESATNQLTDAAKSMTGIVGLIQDIASQINLLSLNATIEAARAGEAGKGFAVVAQEVKSLAHQAAEATEQITREIDNMQSISGNVVGALGGIKSVVEEVREYVNTTASAVEEQSAVAREMSSNMQSASSAVNEISSGISRISSAVSQATQAVSETRSAAESLSKR